MAPAPDSTESHPAAPDPETPSSRALPHLQRVLDPLRLRLLIEVERHGSITAAARACSMGQPTASTHLRTLEVAVGHRLVERAGRGTRLTDAGQLLARHAAVVLSALDGLEQELADLGGGRSGTVRVGSPVRGDAADANGVAVVPQRGVTALGYLSCRAAARRDDAELRAQAAALEDFCARRGWHVAGMVHDIESKSRCRSRPGLGYALDTARQGDASCLVVTELGRLCRSVAELRMVLEAVDGAGARLVVLEPPLDTGTPEGRAVVLTLSAVSEWERRRAAARSSNALAVARANGTTRATIEPALKRRIVRMRGAGLTLQAIADDLNEGGVPTVRGGAKWRPSSVQAAIGYRRPART